MWHGGGDRDCPADRMSREEAAALVRYLSEKVEHDYTLLTWNGVGFDLDILAEESGMLAECRRLAIAHVDMMFHFLCRLGYGDSLDAAARGMGTAGKPEGMNGKLAPALWAEGRREEGAAVRRAGRADDPGTGSGLQGVRRVEMGRQEREASSYDLARGMADGPGGSGAAVTGYFLDGRAVAEGEVHGVDGVTARGRKISGLTGMARSSGLTWCRVAVWTVSERLPNEKY